MSYLICWHINHVPWCSGESVRGRIGTVPEKNIEHNTVIVQSVIFLCFYYKVGYSLC